MTAHTHNTHAWITYWRNSLADIDIRDPVNKKGDWALPEDAFRQGLFPGALTDAVFEQAKRTRRQKTDDEPTELKIFISPLSLTQHRSHGQAQTDDRAYRPFWIAALLDREGHLHVDPNLHAWFVREHLEPSKEDFSVLGQLVDFDAFLTENAPPVDDDWAKLLEYSSDLFKAVTGSHPQDFAEQDGVRKERRIVLGTAKQGINAKILGLYGAVLRDRPALPLLENLVAPGSPRTAPEHYPRCGTQIPMEHTGQMSSTFSLTTSQRQALHSLTQTSEGRILAINGPPGTGKTTLLQSIVASAWVNAAIEGSDPPVILACSTSNQAVTNILDTFAQATETDPDNEDAPYTPRWLPDVHSYGLYLPSKKRFQETDDYLVAMPGFPGWEGLPKHLENDDYVQGATTNYLGHARRAFGDEDLDLAGVVAGLHQEIQASATLLRQTIAAAHSAYTYRAEAGLRGAENIAHHLDAAITTAEAEIQRYGDARVSIRSAIARAPWYERVLLSFGLARRWAAQQITLRLAEVFHQHGIPEPRIDPSNFEESLERHFSGLSHPHHTTLDQARLWQRAEHDFTACVLRLPGDDDAKAELLDAPERILETLDTGLRRRLFLLTARYYEGRWLLQMRGLLGKGANLNARSRKACGARWRRFAKLTPCMVSTFHSAPKIFDFYDPRAGGNRPLYNYIDLLIVDEAGQTTPQVAMATFALARRAVVVGDVKQIEPVWELPKFLDLANRKAQGLPLEDDPAAEARSVSSGSVMLLAQHATAFTADLGESGILLAEHWRCVPEIIDYCNHLAYRGHLIPCRQDTLGDRILPALGRAHVQSPARRQGTSWTNTGEAEAITGWIAAQRSELETFYGNTDISKIVGVITPFAAQKHVLSRALKDAGLGQLTTGTVHTFQGAERPVIIFSPVYSYTGNSSYFFDQGPNMLNVALSRAKDSFLVIGDLRLFDSSRRGLPSGLLGHYLFASQENELGGIASLPMSKDANAEMLADLEAHNAVLSRALTESRETVLIISPYLRPRALDGSDIERQIAAARLRGVEVIIFYNSTFHQKAKDHAKAEEATQRLSQAGADVRSMAGIHLKSLAIDRQWIVQGSFNWLSAERSVERLQNLEASILYRGEEAEAWIERIWKEIIDKKYEDAEGARAVSKTASRSNVPERPEEERSRLEKKHENGFQNLSISSLAEERGETPDALCKRLIELGLATEKGRGLELTNAGRLVGGEVRDGRFGSFLVWPRDLDLRVDE